MAAHRHQISIVSAIACIIFATVACNLLQKPLENPETSIPVCTPPACKPGEEYYCPGECPGGCGTTCKSSGSEYNGCAFTVFVPDALSTDGMSWDVWFAPATGEAGWVTIHAVKMPGADLESTFEQAAYRYGVQNPLDSSVVRAVTVMDYVDQPLQGLEADFTIGNDHLRLLIVLRPETLLGDLAPEMVIYEIAAQAPADIWATWESIFDVIFQSFEPLDCGGV